MVDLSKPLRVLRPDDLLVLDLTFVNLRVSNDGVRAERIDAASPARLIVGLPSQHVAESAFFEFEETIRSSRSSASIPSVPAGRSRRCGPRASGTRPSSFRVWRSWRRRRRCSSSFSTPSTARRPAAGRVTSSSTPRTPTSRSSGSRSCATRRTLPGCEVSPVVIADLVQTLPDRALTVTRSAANPGLLEVALVGPSYTAIAGPAAVRADDAVLARVVARLETRDPAVESELLAWQPVAGSEVELARALHGSVATWTGRLDTNAVAGPYRLAVVEEDRLSADDQTPGGIASRVVFAEFVQP